MQTKAATIGASGDGFPLCTRDPSSEGRQDREGLRLTKA